MKWTVTLDGANRQYELVDPDDYNQDINDGDLVTEHPYAPTAEGIKRDIGLISLVKWRKADSCLVVKRIDWGGAIGICTLIDAVGDYAKNPIYWRLITPITKSKRRLPLNVHFSTPLPLP